MTGQPRPNDVAALSRDGWSVAAEDGFIGLVGPFMSRKDEAGRIYAFEARPHHANLIGVVQGGMIMTFADRVLGILAWEAAGGLPAVTVSFESSFIGAGRIGSLITLRGEVLRRTSSLVFMRGLVRSGDTVVASCQGTWKVLSERRLRKPIGQEAADLQATDLKPTDPEAAA